MCQVRDSSATALMDKAKGFQLTFLDSSIIYSQRAYEKASLKNEYWIMAKSKAIEARATEQQKQYLNAIISYLQGLEYLAKADTMDAYLEFTIYKNIAVIQHDFAEFDNAVNYYDLAISSLKQHIKRNPKVSKKYQDHLQLKWMSLHLNINLFESGNLDEAVPNILRIIDQNSKYPELQLEAKNSLGHIYSRLGDYNKAACLFDEIVKDKNSNDLIKGRALHNLGDSFFQLEQWEKVLEYYQKAAPFKVQNNNGLFLCLLDLGETYIKLEKFDLAINSFERALRLNISIDNDPNMFRIYQLLARSLIDEAPELSKFNLAKFDKMDRSYRTNQKAIQTDNRRQLLRSTVRGYYVKKAQLQYKSEVLLKRRKDNRTYILIGLIAISMIIVGLKKSDKERRRRFYKDLQNTRED